MAKERKISCTDWTKYSDSSPPHVLTVRLSFQRKAGEETLSSIERLIDLLLKMRIKLAAFT
jgi:hypothetical protein